MRHFGYTYSSEEDAAIPKVLVVDLSRILLFGILQILHVIYLFLQDDIDTFFQSIGCKRALFSQFFQNFWKNADLVFYKMKLQKNSKYTILEIAMMYFSCI